MSEFYERTLNDNKKDFEILYCTISKLVSALQGIEKAPDLTGSEMPEGEVSA